MNVRSSLKPYQKECKSFQAELYKQCHWRSQVNALQVFSPQWLLLLWAVNKASTMTGSYMNAWVKYVFVGLWLKTQIMLYAWDSWFGNMELLNVAGCSKETSSCMFCGSLCTFFVQFIGYFSQGTYFHEEKSTQPLLHAFFRFHSVLWKCHFMGSIDPLNFLLPPISLI